jgi:hypothetical protein
MPGEETDRRWIILSLIGATLLTLGLLRGEAAIVLQKAVRICLECIGIG